MLLDCGFRVHRESPVTSWWQGRGEDLLTKGMELESAIVLGSSFVSAQVLRPKWREGSPSVRALDLGRRMPHYGV